ncbi:SMI1/KNR4 family protein [Chryseobacterium sp. JJR-5R]|uniref:SMI1/KNR4 family protein n=1 Tax=Chryseobacterium sp. JJR-5R TaxID=3093923 RepID=UPI002A7490B9|nr:SMI1/KNR4 family protein [Chryseobacterium sp. JJR-5R]WPO83710.1 SMI1/KNR4 family protein [Chryseobacterium sp. JJR-5R]
MISPDIISEIEIHIQKFKERFKNDYKFLPTANPRSIENFENKFSVKIPDDFRWFLLNIANGIINTDQHNFNLTDRINFSDYYYEEDEHNPSLPFKLNNEFNFKTDEYEDFINGTIQLAGYGCGCYSFIVVNGEEYGNTWVDNYASNSEVSPEKNAQKNRLRFHEWIIKEINLMISQKKQSEEFRQKQLQEEKKQINQQYKKLKSDFKAKSATLDKDLSIFEKIKYFF